MRSRLQQAGLWYGNETNPEIDISLAWSVLARLGLPARYVGKGQNGLHEYVIVDPISGQHVASGKGMTLELAMCEAAINANLTSHTIQWSGAHN